MVATAKKGRASPPNAATEGGAGGITPQSQRRPKSPQSADKQPLLGKGAERSDSSPRAGASKGGGKGGGKGGTRLALTGTKAGPSPPESPSGGFKMPRALRCDRTTYLRVVNCVLDWMEGDSGYDGKKEQESKAAAMRERKPPSRLPAFCCCLITCVVGSVVGTLYGGYLLTTFGTGLQASMDWLGVSATAVLGGYLGVQTPEELRLALLHRLDLAASWFWGLPLGTDPTCVPTPWTPCGPSAEAVHEMCADGLLLAGPLITPASGVTAMFLLFWCFYGVAIGADLFMEAIETITSQVRPPRRSALVGRRRDRTTQRHTGGGEEGRGHMGWCARGEGGWGRRVPSRSAARSRVVKLTDWSRVNRARAASCGRVGKRKVGGAGRKEWSGRCAATLSCVAHIRPSHARPNA